MKAKGVGHDRKLEQMWSTGKTGKKRNGSAPFFDAAF